MLHITRIYSDKVISIGFEHILCDIVRTSLYQVTATAQQTHNVDL